MSNLLASLSTAGGALDVFQQALAVVQNNINNASTPGYARQQLNLEALPLDVTRGLAGGVAARGLSSSRDEYAEEEVQRQASALGQYTAQAQATGTIQSLFDISGTGGVSAALTSLFQSFSAWSATPSDATARQSVLASAGALADSVRGLYSSLSQTAQGLDGQIGSTVDEINSLTAQIRQCNVQIRAQVEPDPGVDATLHSALESLSKLANVSVVRQTDGTVTVMLAGGAALVVGGSDYPLSSGSAVAAEPPPLNPQSPPTAYVRDGQGNDVTAQITGGQLGGLLDIRNRVLGSILGDAQQVGTLNQFARGLADTVNQLLEAGTVSTDASAAQGTALFVYDGSDATAAAGSLALNPAITQEQLAPVDASGNANGNAIQLAALGNNSQALLGGLSFVRYFAGIAAAAGRENQTATENQQSAQDTLAQAKSLRDQVSGVSLDQEAVTVLQFQRAYQAVAQVLTVLNSLADTTLNLVQS